MEDAIEIVVCKYVDHLLDEIQELKMKNDELEKHIATISIMPYYEKYLKRK